MQDLSQNTNNYDILSRDVHKKISIISSILAHVERCSETKRLQPHDTRVDLGLNEW